MNLAKPPTTAELLAWITILEKMDFNAYKIADLKSLDPSDKAQLRTSYSVLVKSARDLGVISDNLWRNTL